MSNGNEKFSDILQKYFQIENQKLEQICEELTDSLPPTESEIIKKKVFRKMELHLKAEKLIDIEVTKFRNDLSLFSKKIAEKEMEYNIITSAHVIKARDFLWKRRKKYDFSDGFLAIGGLLIGIGISHILELLKPDKIEVNQWLLIIGFWGAFLLGMGIISKAKQ
jgi:hypothetical protein